MSIAVFLLPLFMLFCSGLIYGLSILMIAEARYKRSQNIVWDGMFSVPITLIAIATFILLMVPIYLGPISRVIYP